MPQVIEKQWTAGDQAVINRREVVIIGRVTPSGLAVVGNRVFRADGTERKAGKYNRDRLEFLTPEIQAEMTLVERGIGASMAANLAVQRADRWLRDSFDTWNRRVPASDDVDKAEKLAAAICGVLGV